MISSICFFSNLHLFATTGNTIFVKRTLNKKPDEERTKTSVQDFHVCAMSFWAQSRCSAAWPKRKNAKSLRWNITPRPLFALSRFYEDCNARKYEAEATWSFSVLQGGKETMFERLTPQKASFEVEADPDTVYDCSTKRYQSADSQVCIQYSFYAFADALSIRIGDRTFENSTIDGASVVHLGQLCQRFRTKDGKETLVLTVIDDMKLYERKKGSKRVEELEDLTLKRGSTFAFAVKLNTD